MIHGFLHGRHGLALQCVTRGVTAVTATYTFCPSLYKREGNVRVCMVERESAKR